MKAKSIYSILTLIISVFAYASCNDSEQQFPSLEIDYHSSTIYFTAQALENETVIINVETNQSSWDVICDQSWCIINKYSDSFTVSANPCNSSKENQAAIITIIAGEATPIQITVKQENLYLYCTPKTGWDFTEEGGIKKLEISCNSKWTIRTEQDWVLIKKDSGIGYENVEIEILPSNEKSVTNAELLITSGDIVCEIKVTRDYKRKVYQIGDYYPDETSPIGVVFHTTNNGKSGLVVDFNEFFSYYSYEYYPLGANSINGWENTDLMAARGIQLYPAANYCRKKGDNWYLPSRVELCSLFENANNINEKITNAGGEKISSGLMSSNEANSACFTYISKDGTAKHLDKKVSTSARAILAF